RLGPMLERNRPFVNERVRGFSRMQVRVWPWSTLVSGGPCRGAACVDQCSDRPLLRAGGSTHCRGDEEAMGCVSSGEDCHGGRLLILRPDPGLSLKPHIAFEKSFVVTELADPGMP